jgi:hypothetical protein
MQAAVVAAIARRLTGARKVRAAQGTVLDNVKAAKGRVATPGSIRRKVQQKDTALE